MTATLLACLLTTTALLEGVAIPTGDPRVALREGDASPIAFLSWDTEGGDRARMNLLYAPVSLQARIDGTWTPLPADDARAGWTASLEESKITLAVRADTAAVDQLRLVFPFDPRAAATTVLPAEWTGTNEMRMPCIVSAPDFGQMLLTVFGSEDMRGALMGRRIGEHAIDFHLEWPVNTETGGMVTIELTPLHLNAPQGFDNAERWRAIRRGWFNMLQPSAQWGQKGRPQSAPPGVLANNVISDPVSCVLHMMADHVVLHPELAPGISAAVPLRNTVEWWLDNGIAPTGEMVSWRDVYGMLDANAGPIIGAWCYVEATDDTRWLRGRLPTLEFLADYLVKRDLNGNGLVESVYSGNYGAQVGRLGASAYDTINSGHEDAYLNALTYRAWRCLSDLEATMGRTEPAARYAAHADRLKANYQGTFLNPETGWLAWWKSEDGELHDLYAPMVTGIAVMYGLVEPEAGRAMLNALWDALAATDLDRFDLGVPLTLKPVRKGDYQQPKPGTAPGTYGRPAKEDGSDTFQQYLNGGCCVSDTYYFLTALYRVGEQEKADTILSAMLKRQVEGVFENGGGFQNGVVDQFPRGAEFYDWNGNTTGYEGHLVYSFSFLQAALYRDPAMRQKVLRPLFSD